MGSAGEGARESGRVVIVFYLFLVLVAAVLLVGGHAAIELHHQVGSGGA